MTDYSMTDKEQVEMIKNWWNRYGKVIAIIVMIGFVLSLGWRYWHAHKIHIAQQASDLYAQLTVIDSQKQKQRAKALAAQLIQKYQSTPYSAMAALWWARVLVNGKNYNEALQKIHWALDHSRVASIRQIARLRAARLLLFQKKPQAAQALLHQVDDKTYQPLIDKLEGAIYMAMNQPHAAIKAYQSAKKGMAALGLNDSILAMEIASP